MVRKQRDILVTDMPGDQYPTLEDAQRAALAATSHDLAATVRTLLASGRLVQRGNQIIINSER
jgi:hypothetical protein